MKKRILINFFFPLLFVCIAIGVIGSTALRGSNKEFLLEEILKFKDPLDPYYKKINKKPWKSDEIIIKFKDNVSTSRAYSVIGSDKHIDKLHTSQLYKVKLGKQTVEQAIAQYKNNPDVEYVQPNYAYAIAAIPNDPGFATQWALRNTGQKVEGTYQENNPGCTGCDVQIINQWDYNTDCSNVVVAVIDTGVNYMHEDLVDNMWDGSSKGYPNHGFNFVEGNDDPMDYHSHGTHVAGIIGARGNNGKGVAGICWKASIMAVKVLGDDGIGYSSTITKGIYYAVSYGAKVINMSLGGGYYDYAMRDAITYAKSKGVLVIAAAGNDGQLLYSGGMYPCMYGEDNIICVGALDQTLTPSWFTNYSFNNSIHIYAPGVNILSSVTSTVAKLIQGDVLSQQGWNMTDSNWSIHDNLGYRAATNPNDFNFTATYKPNLKQSYLYKTFNVSGYSRIGIMYEAYINVEPKYDYFKALYASGTKNPLNDTFDLLLDVSDFKNSFETYFHQLVNCTPLCTIAFSLESDSVIQGNGVAIRNIELYTLIPATNAYKIYHGTSMATPMVAGTAALMWSMSPDSTYSVIRNKILSSADVRPFPNYKQYTYRILNAIKAVEYLSAPKNIKVKKVQ